MKLRNIEDVRLFTETVDKCKKDVWMVSPYGDRYNLKSALSQYVAIAQLLGEHGDEMELFADSKEDEEIFLRFFFDHPEFTREVSVKKYES